MKSLMRRWSIALILVWTFVVSLSFWLSDYFGLGHGGSASSFEPLARALTPVGSAGMFTFPANITWLIFLPQLHGLSGADIVTASDVIFIFCIFIMRHEIIARHNITILQY
jgi:hypothetical protein